MANSAESRRTTRRVTERAWQAIGGSGPPTEPIAMRPHRSRLDDAAAHAALGLALRIGELMLAVGAPAADVTATVLRVAAALGLIGCHVDITYTSITVSYDRLGAIPLTAIRIVRSSTADYTRLQGVTRVAAAVARRDIDIEQAHERLDAIVLAPPTYRRTVDTLGWAGVAGCFAFILGGGWSEAAIAAAATALIAQLLRLLNRVYLPAFFQQAIGAGVATGVAVLLVALDVGVRSSLVVAAGIVVLLAGLSLVNAAQDAISGFPVTAGGRAFEVLTLTIGIVVGIAGVLDIARRAGIGMSVVDSAASPVPVPVALVASAGIAGFWAVVSHARPRGVLCAALAGALAWTTFWSTGALGVGQVLASGVASVVLGFCAEAVSARLRLAPQLLAVCGIVPLLPGLAIYDGLFTTVVNSDINGGLSTLTGAFAVGLALAAGVTLGEYLGRPLSRTADRYDKRVRRDHFAPRDSTHGPE